MATILSSGQITITDITDGISTLNAILSNESHTLPASNAGVVSSYVGSGTDIITYEGATALTYVTSAPTAGKYMVSASSNITVGALSGNNTTVCAVASHSELADATDTATITYTITGVTSAGTNFTITKTQTLSKAKAGSSITGVVNSYLASASSTGVTTATPGWTTTVQTPTASLPYLWNYETVSYSNSTSIDTTPCIIGNYASNGTPGTVITYEYYLSTSASSATGGSWSATVPAVTAGTYMWLRVLTNGTAGTAYRVTGEKGADSTTPGPGVPYIRTYASQLDNNASPSIRVGGTNYGSYSRGHTLVTIVPSTGVITPYTTIDTYVSIIRS